MKKCPKCGETKTLSEFSRNRRATDGRQSRCKACNAEWLRRHREENPEYWLEWNRQYKAKHRDRMRSDARARYAKDSQRQIELSRRYRIKQKYGLTLEEYESILARGCAICRNDGPRMAMDHNHVNGKIRDALCTSCNNGLGRFKDDPALLRSAADYLERHR